MPLEFLTIGSGSVVGLVLGLVGGGGSILAVPLLVYVAGVAPVHVALGTSAVAVAASAALNLIPHWRAGHIKWRCAFLFSAAGIAGAVAGSSVAKMVDSGPLLLAFGILMLVVGAMMLFRADTPGNPDVRLTNDSAGILAPRLIGLGFAVGTLSGFFGIGGGFLIVPALILATGMPLTYAIGTSLVAVTSFGLATAASYAVSGLVDWRVAGLFTLGGAIGGVIGVGLGTWLAGRKAALRIVFAIVVLAVGGAIVWQSATGVS
jgi:uncharacterized protein